MRAVGRIFADILGYIAAVIAAALLVVAAKAGIEPEHTETAGWFWAQFVVYGGLTAALIGAMSFVPFVVLVIVAEWLGLRSFVWYAGAGGLMALAASMTVGGLSAGDTTLHMDATVLIAAGLVGGLVFWALSGRFAGLGDDALGDREPGPS
ncbi:hypothetical protein [Chthonobacter albigriseus]|uniref:hypothetical protein n=1 Tax=Chthonobacter albigriseus TaxID=1683161 RepID=UPI0015EF827E|nr:hypothetical protein [Chthonobacter albigriseus]